MGDYGQSLVGDYGRSPVIAHGRLRALTVAIARGRLRALTVAQGRNRSWAIASAHNRSRSQSLVGDCERSRSPIDTRSFSPAGVYGRLPAKKKNSTWRRKSRSLSISRVGRLTSDNDRP